MGPTVKLSELNEFISCAVCQGYLIDATTVNECLHTFCKSCIVKHIKNDHNECPKCNTVIHERRPLDYLIHDRTKQDIVYKLVPQLYISELKKRIAAHETDGIDALTRFVLAKKILHVVLVQRRKLSNDYSSSSSTSSLNETSNEQVPIYLRCPLSIRVRQIRKLLAFKYQLRKDDRMIILHKGDIVSDDDQVSNLAQSLTFCLNYEISRTTAPITTEAHTDTNDNN